MEVGLANLLLDIANDSGGKMSTSVEVGGLKSRGEDSDPGVASCCLCCSWITLVRLGSSYRWFYWLEEIWGAGQKEKEMNV